ncbi:hypothetical protein BGW39_008804 [Mortierella sp. 14UC]|nr:hypothetical protein BGW39_008804 [Mortierella sp. 14UC]
MAPANRAWIRSKMAAIKKASGIAFSEEIFLSILICLVAKNKHLVLHTTPEAVPELKSTAEQHCAVVFGLTTATIVCHGQQTRTDIIGAITGRHADMATHASYSTPSTQYQFPSGTHHNHHSHHSHQQTPSGQYYQYSNPTDEYYHRNPKLRLEKSRRSVATNHSEASDFSVRPSGHHVAPSIASFRTTSERDHDAASIQRTHPLNDTSEYSFAGGVGGDDASLSPRRPESRSKSAGDAMVEQLASSRPRRSTAMTPVGTDGLDSLTPQHSISRRPTQTQYLQTTSHTGGGASISSSHAPVTPVDFTFPRRRHESVSNAGGYGGAGETSGITYSGRRIAQAIILDGLENASQEVYAVLLEMIINKEINDRNRYVLPDLIIIAIFNSPNVPENVPKQLLDYFSINGTYQFSIPQPRMQTVPARKHALFRRTDWDELSKRMKAVTVSNDMTRYIRDVIVAIRTHEAVYGGLTTRAALDLEAIIKTLAAIFQTDFVTPDLLTIAAEKVFSHRLELKSTRRQRMLAAAAGSSSVSSSSSSPYRTGRLSQGRNNGKTPLRGHAQQGQPPSHISRKGSTGSEASSIGGDSFVEHSDSDDGSSHAGGGHKGSQQHDQGDDGLNEVADETTAADVVRDVLRVVYPPI